MQLRISPFSNLNRHFSPIGLSPSSSSPLSRTPPFSFNIQFHFHFVRSSRDRGSSSSSSLPSMEQYNETVKNQIQALVRVIRVARTYREDNVPSQIEEGLYLGSVAAACNKNVLKSYNVTHILTVASSLRPGHPDDFVYKVVRVVDKEDTNLEIYFDECIDFIDEAKKQGGSVLVHCFIGKSRSVTIVVAYLMKKHGMTLAQALQHVKSIRPVASPNAGFIRQLQDLEKSLRGKQERIAQCQA